ncbi:MAG TPA: ABC transporter ATP-binding protein [Ardenticatenaceae bacterium]|nr:ABC transporter ATP-binding protein [Ardenticatenaceae bacterium]
MTEQSSTTPAIETHNLRKLFGDKVAVAGLSLAVKRGEVFGFLGPNGAGKTTTIKMLLGLVTPTEGEGTLLGKPLGDTRTRARVGFLPEHFRFHEWLSASEFLALHANLYGLARGVARQRIPALLDRVGLAAHRDKRLSQFSKGMLQRIGLAQALLNDPELVILDEPTSGMDPMGRRLVRDIIHELRGEGKSVFLNSHLLSEIEITCDRVAFIKQGRVLQTSVLQDLREEAFSVQIRARGLTPAVLAGLEPWAQEIRAEGEALSLTVAGEAQIPCINRYLVEQGVEVYGLQPQRTSLEERFIQLIGTDGGL